MVKLEKLDSFETSLSDGGSQTLSVETDIESVSRVILLVDNGTAGSQAATYDMVQRVDVDGDGTYMFYDEVLGTQSRSFSDPAVPRSFQVEITNSSGASANYRAKLIAVHD